MKKAARWLSLCLVFFAVIMFNPYVYAESSFKNYMDAYGGIDPETAVTLTDTATFSFRRAGEFKLIKFVPRKSGFYKIKASANEDTYGILYDAAGTWITYDDDSGDMSNFEIKERLEAGTVYYVSFGYYNTEITGDITVSVEECTPSYDDISLIIGGETNVTAENADDILGDGKVSFDLATMTLTLNNATITAKSIGSVGMDKNKAVGDAVILNAIYYSGKYKLNINLIGNNKIICENNNINNTFYGIKYDKKLVITGDSLRFDVSGSYHTVELITEAGSFRHPLEMYGLSLRTKLDTNLSCEVFKGIYSGPLMVNKATINIENTSSNVNTFYGMNILDIYLSIIDSSITIKDAANVGYGIDTNANIDITDSDINITDYLGMKGENNLYVSGSSNIFVNGSSMGMNIYKDFIVDEEAFIEVYSDNQALNSGVDILTSKHFRPELIMVGDANDASCAFEYDWEMPLSNFKYVCVPGKKLPEITSSPADKKVIRGSNAVFKVAANGYALNYQWQVSTDNGATWKKSSADGYNTDKLTIRATESLNGRLFRCVVSNNAGKVYSQSAKLTTLAVISGNPKSVSVQIGKNATFSVKSRSSVATYQWQVSTNGGVKWNNSSAKGNKTATLTIPVTASKNGYIYRCKVTNGSWFEYSIPATLSVKIVITTQPESVKAKNGTVVKFYCKASGVAPAYQWQVLNKNGKWVNSSSAGNNTSIVRFTATSSKNGLKFRCKVTDGDTVLYSNIVTFTYVK